MNRPARTWLLFTLCLSIALGGLGWITATTLQLDQAQRLAEQQAVVEENTRLALWRLDSAVLPILMEENARPYYQYSPQYRMLRNPADPNGLTQELDSVLNTSPLVQQEIPYRCVYFQVDPQGNVISPQLPGVVNRSLVDNPPSDAHANVGKQIQWLYDLQDNVQLQKVAEAIPNDSDRQTQSVADNDSSDTNDQLKQPPPQYRSGKDSSYQQQLTANDLKARNELNKLSTPNYSDSDNRNQPAQGGQSPSSSVAGQQQSSAGSGQQEASVTVTPQQSPAAVDNNTTQSRPQVDNATSSVPGTADVTGPPPRNDNESQVELAHVEPQDLAQTASPRQLSLPLANIYSNYLWYQPATRETDPARVGVITPLWRNQRLLLTRKVVVADQEFVQGVWLDWPMLEQKLLADIRDLLPQAHLAALPAADTTTTPATTASLHRMALLPVRLDPGELAFAPATGLTPVEQTLLIAWIAISLAALAAAGLLYGVMALSERRAAFVSAVTHELRTPLTTFRMYTEMLGAGMVRDEEKKAKYLGTLRAEAVRLGHLVENVLAYARLERGGHHNPRAGRMEPIAVPDLLERLAPHLVERAEQVGMVLKLPEVSSEMAALELHTDPAAVEQILFNLVDNACKYGRSPTPCELGNNSPAGHIEIALHHVDRRLYLRIRDYGVGIPADQQPRLFQPFSRSAEVAANTPTRTPGVGLGLALCRRLARAIGGDLRWDASIRDGAAFELTLPCQRSTAQATAPGA